MLCVALNFVFVAYETLVGQLKKKTHATTAMKEGLLREPIAAEAYAKVSAYFKKYSLFSY
jgi:hypothetical protein